MVLQLSHSRIFALNYHIRQPLKLSDRKVTGLEFRETHIGPASARPPFHRLNLTWLKSLCICGFSIFP